ncbi:MAG TPA: 2,3-epoxybenzoyl-CoA dihydrolase [Acidimicrobiales bacterium]|nr:2,3-epoxybenzoyl-CoA dihydrolase [Acidimicrobiales bacterium]
MSDDERPAEPVDFRCERDGYRHWRVEVEGPVATVTLAVDPEGGLRPDYELKLNSYDLSVDIELYDIVQRLRFEHPEVGAVVVTGGLDRVFCAGANIQMLAGSSHEHKVNFCKFTNETRLGIEDAGSVSGQKWIAALNGTAAGGGYELALACDEIILVDDRSSTVSLPEVPLLGVLPGTGGLTRVVDKRHVRRDLADVFATRAEGVRGQQAVTWKLVDSIAAPSGFADLVRRRASEVAAGTPRPEGPGVTLGRLERTEDDASVRYSALTLELDRSSSVAHFRISGPAGPQPASSDDLVAAGDRAWILRLCRELDDAILHLRLNETAMGTWVFHTTGDHDAVLAVEETLERNASHWLVREIRAYWKRTLKRLDTSSRTLVALVEPGSCFTGTLAELVLASDRSFMLDGEPEDEDLAAPCLVLTGANDGAYPMGNGLSRLETRYWGHPGELTAARGVLGKPLLAQECADLGLVTFTPDDLDWDDEVRLALEERASFSPDALTGLEANLRFVGPETMETKIFGRLSAWQNWIFLRPNASGPDGALRRYGTGSRPSYDRKRV